MDMAERTIADLMPRASVLQQVNVLISHIPKHLAKAARLADEISFKDILARLQAKYPECRWTQEMEQLLHANELCTFCATPEEANCLIMHTWDCLGMTAAVSYQLMQHLQAVYGSLVQSMYLDYTEIDCSLGPKFLAKLNTFFKLVKSAEKNKAHLDALKESIVQADQKRVNWVKAQAPKKIATPATQAPVPMQAACNAGIRARA
ncbi:hypothetical protein FBU31_001152 [Coemansia sp. 'formosensis']|nr:hypothetical protein FBU31_001152 [Coemansia sp. 'formosensis']